ncbi:hypothetical protein DFQ29_004169, partial [Apophysomyces sp. BC1021]
PDEEKEEIKMRKAASWNCPGCEASTQFLDIAELGRGASQDPKKAIGFVGTDYGLRVLATTVPFTTERTSLHFDLYNQRLDGLLALTAIPKKMSILPKSMKTKADYLEEKTF